MDQATLELLAQLATSKKGNKNISGLLNTMSNPVFAFMSGVYDPVSAGAAGGGGGQLWSSYAGNSQYPVVQDIMKKIEGGADPYYLNSYIESLGSQGADLGGFQTADLKSLGKALLKEYTGSSGKDVWSKAGLRNPMEQYTTGDVPLTKSAVKALLELQSRQSRLSDAEKNAAAETSAAKNDLGPLYGRWGFDEIGRANAPTVKQLSDYLHSVPNGDKIDWSKVDPTTGEIYKWKQSKRKNLNVWDPRNLIEPVMATIGRTAEDIWNMNFGKPNASLESVANIPKPDSRALLRYQKAQEQEGLLAQQANVAKAREEAVRRGVLRARMELGQSPLKDQIGGMMQFLSGSK